MKADCNKEPHSLSGFIKNKVGKYSGAQSYHILKQQKERTEDAVLEMIMYVLHFFASVLLLVVNNPLGCRYTLETEVLIFTSSQNSPFTQHSQYISVLFEAGAPQKFPTRVTGQCHDKRARER